LDSEIEKIKYLVLAILKQFITSTRREEETLALLSVYLIDKVYVYFLKNINKINLMNIF